MSHCALLCNLTLHISSGPQVTDRWQKFSDLAVEPRQLDQLAARCNEFLVHGVDVEGKQLGAKRTCQWSARLRQLDVSTLQSVPPASTLRAGSCMKALPVLTTATTIATRLHRPQTGHQRTQLIVCDALAGARTKFDTCRD